MLNENMLRQQRIMFVCHGNICRSPMAEFIFKDLLDTYGLSSKYKVESTATSTEEIYNGKGNPVYHSAKRELAEHGISCDGKFARQLKRSDYPNYDFFIVMDNNNVRNIKRIFGSDADGKVWKLLDFYNYIQTKELIRFAAADISDPWYTGDFTRTYDDIKKGCEGLLLYLEKGIIDNVV